MNIKPVIAQKSPYPIEVEEGKSYYWCQCGQSKKQPFCDASHKGTSFHPVVYKATETKKCIFVDANLHLINPFVMKRTQKFRNIQ
jgi:CDGSH-type Zn-finger protein